MLAVKYGKIIGQGNIWCTQMLIIYFKSSITWPYNATVDGVKMS